MEGRLEGGGQEDPGRPLKQFQQPKQEVRESELSKALEVGVERGRGFHREQVYW